MTFNSMRFFFVAVGISHSDVGFRLISWPTGLAYQWRNHRWVAWARYHHPNKWSHDTQIPNPQSFFVGCGQHDSTRIAESSLEMIQCTSNISSLSRVCVFFSNSVSLTYHFQSALWFWSFLLAAALFSGSAHIFFLKTSRLNGLRNL